MSRRRRNRNRGGISPPANPPFRPYQRPHKRLSLIGPLPPYRGLSTPLPSAPLALDHTARRRTVRSLIRTVLTDRDPRTQTRSHLDVSRRAVLRSRRSPGPWSLNPEVIPSPRAFTCARRSIRREVLFAIRGTGKGSRSPRRHTSESKVRC